MLPNLHMIGENTLAMIVYHTTIYSFSKALKLLGVLYSEKWVIRQAKMEVDYIHYTGSLTMKCAKVKAYITPQYILSVSK